jgi:hypothetical protein
MATKKKGKAVKSEEALLNRIVTAYLEQLEDADSSKGITFDEMRTRFDLEPGMEEFGEVASTMKHLREVGVLTHRFMVNGQPSDIDFQDDPADIPNIQKRPNAKGINQLVFFLSLAAKATIDGEEDPCAVLVEVAEGERELTPSRKQPVTRNGIATFIESIAEVVGDASDEDRERLIAAGMGTYLKILKPAKI